MSAPPPAWDVRGRSVMLTGASSGIGLAGARALAALGANLWLVCRSRERGEAAVAACEAEGGGGKTRLLLADLAGQAAIRRLADDFLRSDEPLHVLVNNAGAVFFERLLTTDGIESTFAVNHLAPFLLTNLLLPRLCESAPARVITVASAGHRTGRIRLDDLESKRKYRAFSQYGNTKLANVLFTHELARRLEGGSVVAHSLHPGVVDTNLGMQNSGWLRNVWKAVHPLFSRPETGAQTLVHLVTAPEVQSQNGGYWSKGRPQRAAARGRDDAMAQALWQKSVELVGLESA
ncbi:MAG: SDR family NAD(P)-dependent oxidoreductase [Myxococcota bacterium]